MAFLCPYCDKRSDELNYTQLDKAICPKCGETIAYGSIGTDNEAVYRDRMIDEMLMEWKLKRGLA